jgi:GrpB-like predicted nucleotidyltransferase (UPF0157 family)
VAGARYTDDVPEEVEDRLRTLCLALPEAHEQRAWVGTRWMVRARTFAHVLGMNRHGCVQTVLVFRAEDDELESLCAAGPPFFFLGWGRSAVGMTLDSNTDWAEVGELVTESFCVLAPRKLVSLVERPVEGGSRHHVSLLVDAGLGLAVERLALQVTTSAHVRAGAALRDTVARVVHDVATAVEHIGSASVTGLLAKPIVDLCVGVVSDQQRSDVRARLERNEWVFRGDAGERGGQVFVLESHPGFRVAHLHVVDHGGTQWRNYLALRDRLRTDAKARRRYASVKRSVMARVGDDREAYTEGKTDIVRALLSDSDAT